MNKSLNIIELNDPYGNQFALNADFILKIHPEKKRDDETVEHISLIVLAPDFKCMRVGIKYKELLYILRFGSDPYNRSKETNICKDSQLAYSSFRSSS